MGIGINRSGKKNILKSEWSEVIDWNVVYLEKQEVESLRFQSEKYQYNHTLTDRILKWVFFSNKTFMYYGSRFA